MPVVRRAKAGDALRLAEAGDHVFPLGNDPQRDIVMVRRVSGAGASRAT